MATKKQYRKFLKEHDLLDEFNIKCKQEQAYQDKIFDEVQELYNKTMNNN